MENSISIITSRGLVQYGDTVQPVIYGRMDVMIPIDNGILVCWLNFEFLFFW